MFNKKTLTAVLAAVMLVGGICSAQSLEENWNDYLHYARIGRLDLAKGYAQAILQGNPDPVQLLKLARGNPQGMMLIQRMVDTAPDPQLVELSQGIADIIDQGRYARRTNAGIIVDWIEKLSGTKREHFNAVKGLQDAGEYAIPPILNAMSDRARRAELPNIIKALPQIGRDAIRPLAAAMQTKNTAVKAEIAKALGEIKYPQALPYLKYAAENDDSPEIRQLATQSINQIDAEALRLSAAHLFYRLAENYYYHAESLAPAEDAELSNVWFWDSSNRRLAKEKVPKDFFNELMAMRTCEWALKADPGFGQAIGLWLAAYFKAESGGLKQKMPQYFGPGHADAMTYATTAGPEYLHQALDRAIKDKNSYVALGVIEALATIAGEKSLLYRIGPDQPLTAALSFNDPAVRYSAAIAIAAAGPQQPFGESKFVVRNLAEAIAQTSPDPQITNEWVPQDYALRSASVMLKLAVTRNRVINLAEARDALTGATTSKRPEIQILAAEILARLEGPGAQRAIAIMALADGNNPVVRISAFNALAVSAKINANLLDDDLIDAVYSLVGSQQVDPALRAAAASAYGALNLPSRKVKDLILDQTKS